MNACFGHPARPWPRERKVTVCIAAECRDGDDAAFVLCSDFRANTSIGHSESMVKMRRLPHGFRCLTAGDDVEIYSTVPIFEKFLSELESPDETNVKVAIEAALTERKRQKAARLVSGRYALTYDQFIDIGKQKLPEDAFRKTIGDIERIHIDASFIFVGFPEGFPMIVQTEQDGTAWIREDFATIGEGSYLAQASMLFRTHMDTSLLVNTLFNVYEAKKAAERVGSVGLKTMLLIYKSNGEVRSFHPDDPNAFAELDALHDQLGPKPILSDLSISTDHLKILSQRRSE